MTVTLNIQNDEELRAYCKDLIRGQYLSFSREEVRQMVYEELTTKIKGLNEERFEKWIKEALRSSVEMVLIREYDLASWKKDYILPYIERYLNTLLLDTGGKEKFIYEIARQLTDTK